MSIKYLSAPPSPSPTASIPHPYRWSTSYYPKLLGLQCRWEASWHYWANCGLRRWAPKGRSEPDLERADLGCYGPSDSQDFRPQHARRLPYSAPRARACARARWRRGALSVSKLRSRGAASSILVVVPEVAGTCGGGTAVHLLRGE